jgi:hypothetical protein
MALVPAKDKAGKADFGLGPIRAVAVKVENVVVMRVLSKVFTQPVKCRRPQKVNRSREFLFFYKLHEGPRQRTVMYVAFIWASRDEQDVDPVTGQII